MSHTPKPVRTAGFDPSRPLRVSVYRYFFYGWLFRDADRGSSLERATALRHNCHQARWLRKYLMRWLVTGAGLTVAEQLAEASIGSPVLSAVLLVALIVVVLYLLITSICWLFLQLERQAR